MMKFWFKKPGKELVCNRNVHRIYFYCGHRPKRMKVIYCIETGVTQYLENIKTSLPWCDL